ncbi:MAG: hypothetical protein ACFFED_09375 [Candidatus Thorarchaeota archaeon]
MSKLSKAEHPTQMELDVLRSFGWAVIELESVLYERYTHQSVKHSLISLEEFRKALRDMEAKGFVSSVGLHGKRAYKKSIVSSKIISEISPKNPNEEMRLALGSLKVKRKDELPSSISVSLEMKKSTGSPLENPAPTESVDDSLRKGRVTTALIVQSQLTGDEILQRLERVLVKRSKTGKIKRNMVAIHIQNMRKALSISDESFLKYIESELPDLMIPLNRILTSKGSDYLLLSLRMVDSRLKKYI